MNNVNVLNQMAEYDFSSPINATIIFEESDNELRELIENSKPDNTSKEAFVEKCESKNLKVHKKSENLNDSEILNTSIRLNGKIHKKIEIIEENNDSQTKTTKKNECTVDNKNNIEPNKKTNDAKRQHNPNEIINNQHLVGSENREVTRSSGESVPHCQINGSEPINIFVEDLLNDLSEHLVLIMEYFYYYKLKKNVTDTSAQEPHKRDDLFSAIKLYAFESSYSTMVSIIIPQERNVNFINKFLDNTVTIANKKPFQWKCQKRHVIPFFKELLIWSKQKQAGLKTFHFKPSNNENNILKAHLSVPHKFKPQPLHTILSNSKNVQNSDGLPTPDTQNNVCIFASGTPGSEITINISPETLLSCNEKQYNNTVDLTRNQNIYPSSIHTAQRIRTAPPPYRNHHNVQNKNLKYHHSSSSSNSQNASQHIQNIQEIVNSTQNYYQNDEYVTQIQNNVRQPLQNMGQPVQNQAGYPTQLPYIYPTRTYDSGCVNNFHDNRNNYNQVKEQFARQMTSRPIITNVTSLNPMASRRVFNRCCMCGKNTEFTCAKCNKQSYCSNLCQELDSQLHKTMCGNT